MLSTGCPFWALKPLHQLRKFSTELGAFFGSTPITKSPSVVLKVIFGFSGGTSFCFSSSDAPMQLVIEAIRARVAREAKTVLFDINFIDEYWRDRAGICTVCTRIAWDFGDFVHDFHTAYYFTECNESHFVKAEVVYQVDEELRI